MLLKKDKTFGTCFEFCLEISMKSKIGLQELEPCC